MERTDKKGSLSRSTRLFALALLLSGCLTGVPGANAAENIIISSGKETVNSPRTANNIQVSGTGLLLLDGTGEIGAVEGNVSLSDRGQILVTGGYVGLTAKNISSPGGSNTSFSQTGGSLIVGGTSPALVQFEDVSISAGTTSIGSTDVKSGGGWRMGSHVYGDRLTVTNAASITLGDFGGIGALVGEPNCGITISGGNIVMQGAASKSSLIRATAKDSATRGGSTKYANYGVINISSGNITVDSDKSGVIMARETNFTGGTITVNGLLTVAGSAASGTTGGTDVIAAIKSTTGNSQWGDFNFGGGRMIATSGKVDFIAGGMTLNASYGQIDGDLTIIDSGATIIGSTSGVYSTNLNVTASPVATEVFTIAGDLAVYVTSLTKTGDATPGVNVAGKLVVTGATTAGSSVAQGALKIASGGSVTGNLSDFANLGIDMNTLDVTSATADANLAKALKDSAGTLNLNSGFNFAPSMTTEQYNKLKSDLGLANGKLNLLNIIIDDQVEVETDASGHVNTAINNAGSEVTIDASKTTNPNIEFTQEVTVKDIIIENGSNVSKITADRDITFTGVSPSGPLVQGGAKNDIDLTAQGNVILGVAGNSNAQGGVIGDVTLTGANAGSSVEVDVADGSFSTGNIVVDNGGTLAKDVAVTASGTKQTTLNAGNIDLSKVDSSKTGTVDAGSNAVVNAGDITFNNNAASGVTAEDGGVLNADSVKNVGTLDVQDGEVTVKGTLSFSADPKAQGAIAKGGAVTAANLVLGSRDNWVVVGENAKDGKGELYANSARLNGGSLFGDPAWNQTGGNDIYDASKIVIENFAGNIQDGNVIAGQNSYYLYGSLDTKTFETRVLEAGTWGPNGSNPITAAAGLYKPLVIGKGQSLIVDGAIEAKANPADNNNPRPWKDGGFITTTTNTAYFAADSLLFVDAKGIGANAALTAGNGAGTLTVEKDAKLYIHNAQNGQKFKLTSGFTTVNGGGNIGVDAWSPDQNLNDSPMVHVDVDGSGGDVLVEAFANNAYDVYGRISDGAANTLNWVYGVDPESPGPVNDIWDEGGIGFVSRAASNMFNNVGLDGQAASIEGAAQMAALGGAPLNAFNIMRLTSNSVAQRFSFTSGMISGASDTAFDCQPSGNRVSIWGGGIYEHGRVRGMDVGPFENSYRSNLGGGNVGIDFTFGDNVRAGVMGSFGGGRNKSRGGDFAYTENDFDYQAVRGYAGWSMCNFSLLLDGGFTNVKNKIDQRSFDGPLHATAKVHAWDVGLTAEYKVSTGFIDVIPHAGIRYEGVNTRGHDVRYAGGADIMRVDSDTQHVLTIPVGVSLAKNINFCNGWNLSPYVDAGARFSVGDRSYKTNTRLAGVAMPGFGYKSKIVDAVAFDGSAGVNVDNGRFFGGVNYNLTHSKNQTTHGFWANVGVSF